MTTPHLSQWTEAASLVFVSGQLPFDENRRISATDIGGQTRQAVKNLESVLRDAGLELTDVVKTTVWLTRATDFAAFNESYAAGFGETRPARSTVVCPLVLPEALIEIEAIARRR
jgi:2-iminobutanoate/2-iminopropanoate deaminase